jgi:hypothetical protein
MELLATMAREGTSIPKSINAVDLCVLVLKNGFTVTGESAQSSPENFGWWD